MANTEARRRFHSRQLEKLKKLIDDLDTLAEEIKSDKTWSKNAKVAIESEGGRLGTIQSTLQEVYDQ